MDGDEEGRGEAEESKEITEWVGGFVFNQEIVKQNVLLQENLARTRQEHHAILQENVRLKGRIVAIESKLRESEGVCRDTKVKRIISHYLLLFFFREPSVIE